MIVCVSRRTCPDRYAALTALTPRRHDPSDDKGAMNVVMTGSALGQQDWQQHIRNQASTVVAGPVRESFGIPFN